MRFSQRLRSCWDGFFDGLVDLCFPAACRHCGQELPLGTKAADTPYAELATGHLRWTLFGGCSLPLLLLCTGCCRGLRTAPRGRLYGHGASFTTLFEPTPEFFALLHAFKYDGIRQLASWFGELLVQRLGGGREAAPQLLLPVPLHAERLRQRGFNQAEEIAAVLTSRLAWCMAPQLLQRTSPTPPLSQQEPERRAALIRGAFQLGPARPHPGADLVLVDDVITTGATLFEMLRCLRPVWPRAVHVVCLAASRQFLSSLSSRQLL